MREVDGAKGQSDGSRAAKGARPVSFRGPDLPGGGCPGQVGNGGAGMRLFSSNATNRIDAKGRVSVPAAFRKVLEQEETPGVVLIPQLEGLPAIEGMGQSRLEQFAAAIEERDSLDEITYALKVAILGEARQLQIDDAGRIVLSQDLREAAGLTGDEALFVGLGRTFQIWSPAAYEERRAALKRLQLAHMSEIKMRAALRGGPA